MSLAVLFITRKWPPAVGGMETYSVELARRLEVATRLELRALPGCGDGKPPAGPALIGFGLKTAAWLVRSRQRFDVAHGGDMAVWPLVWLARARGLARRAVLSAHGTDVSLGTRAGLVARAYAAYLRLGASLMPQTTVVANSAATAGLVRHFGFKDVRTVPLAATAPAPAPADLSNPYIAFVGRLTRSKGCGWFAREVLPKLPGLRLKVAGTIIDPSERTGLEAEGVEYVGPLFGEALAAFRRNAVAVVVPNLVGGPESFEGFGLAATEAAAAGAVVIAARAHGLADAVRDSLTGYLLEPGDANAWAAKIAEISRWRREERQAFVARAQQVSAAYYSWDRVTRETLAAYRSDATGDE